MTTKIPIGDIHVVDRHRTDLGDVAALADSMREVGQLQPIVITPERRLVAGERRIAAARSLGWTEIEAKVADNLADAGALLRAESDENTCRRAFTLSEAESIARAREEWLKPLAEAAKAQAPGKPRGEKVVSSGNLPEETPERPADRETRNLASAGTGYSASTLRKVREVKEIATSEDKPEHVREVAREALAEMDRSGNAAGPHKRVKVAEQAADTQQVTDYLAASESLRKASWRKNYMTAIARMTEVIRFQPDQVIENADEVLFAELESSLADLERYVDRVKQLRPKGLRVVGGDLS